MIKVLWVSATIFDEQPETQSGVWVKALALKLAASQQIMLANISVKRDIHQVIETEYKSIKQWAIPFLRSNKKGIPPLQTQQAFFSILSHFTPDIIYVWGSENPLGLLPFDNSIKSVKVIAIQGVLSSISEYLLLGLSFKEILSTFGIREFIKFRSIISIKRSFNIDGEIEKLMLQRSNYIVTQSDWTEYQISEINPSIKRYRTHRCLRNEFLIGKKWLEFEHNDPILYSAAVGYTLKGLHTLIRALAIVKKAFPKIKLRLAGNTGRSDFLGDGYIRLIHRMIKQYDLAKNVEWLGPLTATQIVQNLQYSSVFINPSYVESYSLVLAEAMCIGTPSVVAYSGAMPELALDKKEALFYSPVDYKYCASAIIRLLTDLELARFISSNALERSFIRNESFDIVQEQLSLYEIIHTNN